MQQPPSTPDSPWYKDGLCFTCTSCGKCCTGFEGYVWVDEARIKTIADFLGLSVEATAQRYVRQVGKRLSLVEKKNYDCVFWDKGCTIYPVRPTQCRTFPFWPENLESPEDWEEVAGECPGVNHGARYSLQEIERLRGGGGETGPSTRGSVE